MSIKPKEPEQAPVTVLPDGSAFAVMSYPLPKDHWLYAERQYECGADEPNELGKPILTHALCDAVVSAVRYAIRGATNCGKENDFDPDALVQNAVYALCGPYGSIQSKEPEQEPNSTTSMSPTSPKALQPEQEPVAHFGSAYVNENGVHVTTVLGPVAIPQDAKLYTTPPQRKPLTDELWDLLDAVEKELNRRAIPEAWLLVAHKAGRAYIEARGIKE